MKPKSTLRSFLAIAGSSLLAISFASAAIYYWDNNGATAGFGTAAGTWDSAGTLGSGTQGWGTDVTGLIAPTGTITTLNTDSTTDDLNFGTVAAGLAAGTIAVNGNVSAGSITFGSASGAVVLSAGAITLTAAQTTTVNNTTNTISSILAGAGTSFTKAGTGTLILTGANSYTGTTIIRGGTLNLGNSSTTGSLASTALELQYGALSYTRTDSATQNFSTTAIKTGAASVTANAGNILGLGDITRTAGGTLAVGTTGTITTSDVNDATGILGPWAFYGTQYATVASGTIGGYTGTTQNTESNWTDAAANYEITTTGNKTLTGSRVGNTFRYSGAGAGAILLGNSGSTLTTNGILAVGGALTISRTGTTESVIAGSTGEIVIAGSQAVTISAPIPSGAVTYSGTGALTLFSGTNTYAGGFTLNSGSVGVAAGTYGGFGAGTLTVTGGTITAANSDAVTINNDLNWGGSILFRRGGGSSGTPTFTFNGALTLSDNFALRLGTGTTNGSAVFTNNISGAYGINLVSDGQSVLSNTLTLSGTNNTFSGGLSLTPTKGMFLNINSATALGATAGTFTIGSGGVVTIDNTSADAITLTNNNPLAFNNGFVFTGTRDLNMGTGAVNLGGAARTITVNGGTFTLGGVIFNAVTSISKAGAGTLALTGTNTYAVNTNVNGGTLQLSASGQLGSGSYANNISIANLALLQYSSTVNQTLSGVISGRGNLIKDTGTASTLTLSNANTLVGNVTVSAGTLKTGQSNGLGFGGLVTTVTNATTVNSGATLDLNGAPNVNEPIILNGTGVVGNGALINTSGTPAVINNGIAGLAVPVTGSGSGFSSAPTIVISGTGTGATAVINSTSLGLTTASISSITNGGTANWAIGDTLSVTGGNGNGAIATVTSVSAGAITGLSITTAGTGYTGAPTTLTKLTGSGTGTPTITGNASNFTVGGINMTAAGSGYTGTPTFTLNGSAAAVTPTLSSVILAADSSIGSSGDITINAVVSESVAGRALTKVGAGTVTLSGANTYTGTTAVSGGTLVITGATQATSAITFGGGVLGLNTASSVTAASATVDFTGQQVLVTGPTGDPSYTLLTASSIPGTSPTLAPGSVSGYSLQVVSNQLLLVQSGGGITFADWKAANGNPAVGLGDDHDGDGVDSGTEFFLGGDTNTTGFTALPPVVNTGGTLSVTWAKHPNYPGAYNTDFVVETSGTLAAPWTAASLGAGPNQVVISSNNVTYTFPAGTRNFARLKVTGP